MRLRDPLLISRAADLRKTMTDAEIALWRALNRRQVGGAKFSRQVAIAGYICDFVCREHRLIVEADGSQHAESDYDALRDGRLAANGYRVLRFWNADILRNLEGVIAEIALALPQDVARASTAHPQPLPVGEGSSARG